MKIYIEDDHGEKYYIEARKCVAALMIEESTPNFKPIELHIHGEPTDADMASIIVSQLTTLADTMIERGVPLGKIVELFNFMTVDSIQAVYEKEKRKNGYEKERGK